MKSYKQAKEELINNLKYEDDGKGVTHCFSRFNDVKQFIEDIEHSQDFNTIISLEDTEDLMYSSDFKDRFKAEYYQTKIRYEKLHKMIVKYEAGTLEPNIESIKKISELFEVSIDKLLKDDGFDFSKIGVGISDLEGS